MAFNRKEVLIITAGGIPGDIRPFVEMAETNIKNIKKFGYDYYLADFSNIERKAWFGKPAALLNAVRSNTHKWVVWMDTDSIMLQPIDELFKSDDYDVGLLVKERDRWDKGISRASHHGNFLYAQLIPLRVGSEAIWFLEEWERINKTLKRKDGDLLGIHKLLGSLMQVDETLFDRAGEVEITSEFRLRLIDPYIYSSMAGILENKRYDSKAKILHFKGRALKRAWKKYSASFLC